MPDQNVVPGRIVRYFDGEEEFPGVITTVHSDDCVNLYVFPDGTYPGRDSGALTSIVRDDDQDPDAAPSWRFPPRG